VAISRLSCLFDDWGYLQAIGRPELYYSYGIPLYRRFGRVNWFHLLLGGSEPKRPPQRLTS
jgi:hypothetical protein